MGLASFIIYKTNFFRQLWENEKINSFFMTLTLVDGVFLLSLMLYITTIRPLLGQEPDIEKIPILIPIMTAGGVILPVFLTFAIWPIWGFFSPLYIFVLSIGYIFTLGFLPGGTLGTIIFWLVTIAVATYSHLIPHAGHEHSW